MIKTSKEVEGDVYRLLSQSLPDGALTGNVYRHGMRPRDSRLEDAVVIFTGGLTDEVQTGVVTINVFVPDIDPWQNGCLTEDSARCEQIEALMRSWAMGLTASRTGGYLFRLQTAIATYACSETAEHFVAVKLAYRYFDGEE